MGHIWATLGHFGLFLAIFGPFCGIFGQNCGKFKFVCGIVGVTIIAFRMYALNFLTYSNIFSNLDSRPLNLASSVFKGDNEPPDPIKPM